MRSTAPALAKAAIVVVGVVMGLTAACSLIDTSGLVSGAATSDVDGGGEPADASAAETEADTSAVVDAHADADLPIDAGPLDAAGCPSGRGPAMVRATAFCIDSTEVTNAQYQAFMDANLGLGGAPSACAWKTSNTPTGWPPPVPSLDNPVANVDWCDAEAFCRWSGKRLCGLMGTGGALDPNTARDAKTGEWFHACTGDGKTAYPYGGTFQAGICNTGRTTTAPAQSFAQCIGGLPGLYDMSGNVWEWVNWCDADAGASDTCHDHGSWFGGPDASVGCAIASGGPRSTRNSGTGFRCCASVP